MFRLMVAAWAALLVVMGAGGTADAAPPREGRSIPPTRTRPPLVPARAGKRSRDGTATWHGLRHPVRVHGPASLPRATFASIVHAIEDAWDTATLAFELPPPDVDPVTGGYDVYVVYGVAGLSDTFADHDTSFGGFDRRSAYSFVDADVAPGCLLETLVTTELVRAIGMRTNPAMDDGTSRATATALAKLAVPCAASLDLGESVYQSNPGKAVMDDAAFPDRDRSVRYARGASLFPTWLDDTFGTAPGRFVTALWALTPTKSPPTGARYISEPDVFDVMRTSMKDAISTGSTFEDVLASYAVARTFFGSADDGIHLLESRALGDRALVRRDWSVPWPTTPRRFASVESLAPTGSSLVVVDTRSAPLGARLRIEASWEEHAKMRWTAVKVDAEGRKRAAIPVAAYDKATESQATITELGGTAFVYVVGVEVGEPFVPIDPDDGAWEPHAYLLTLAEEKP
ncbi:MAG: hypothetical protein U0169_14640 [Polyangiaceae bacterium]